HAVATASAQNDNGSLEAEVQTTADDNVSATGQQHTEQPESNNEGGEVD
ncbi:hypothetical protein Tco_0437187, partial [Tanacetum coccineum]